MHVPIQSHLTVQCQCGNVKTCRKLSATSAVFLHSKNQQQPTICSIASLCVDKVASQRGSKVPGGHPSYHAGFDKTRYDLLTSCAHPCTDLLHMGHLDINISARRSLAAAQGRADAQGQMQHGLPAQLPWHLPHSPEQMPLLAASNVSSWTASGTQVMEEDTS